MISTAEHTIADHPQPTTSPQRSARALAFFALILSGTAGLMYEVVWSRAIAALFGSVITATGVLLAVFMIGLALGAELGGRLVVRIRRPLALFGLVELVIGIAALASPSLLNAIETPVAALEGLLPEALALLAPALACGLLLGPIVLLMGATFPLFLAHLAGDSASLGTDSGKVYGINTLGAVAGTLAAGFVLIPALGITRSLLVAAGFDLVAGLITLALGWAAPPRQLAPDGAAAPLQLPTEARAAMRTGSLVAFLGGAAALVLEVAWFRGLMLIVGSSVYAISLMLAAFLTGLGVGSLVLGHRADREPEPRVVVGGLHALIAFSATLVTVLLQLVPGLYILVLASSGGRFALVTVGTSAIVTVLLLGPTLLMGAALPAAIRMAAGPGSATPAAIAGRVYAASSIGSGLGALLAGVVLVPSLGLRGSVVIAVLLSIAAALICLVPAAARGRRRSGLQATALTLLLWLIWASGLFPWDWRILTAGYYAYAHLYSGSHVAASGPTARQVYLDQPTPFTGLVPDPGPDTSSAAEPQRPAPTDPAATGTDEEELLSWDEGRFAQVAVVEQGGVRSMLINGKADASNGHEDMRTQLLLGHLPVLLAPEPPHGRAMVIGLGSGVTAGAVASYPFDDIEAVEIEPAVVRAAAKYFAVENRHVLADSRVHLHIDDARRILARDPSRLALLTSEPSNLWMSGVSLLFTEEFFHLAADRLGEHGVLCQWLHLYQVGEDDVRTLVATLARSFPHMVALADGADLLLVASRSPLTLDPEVWRTRLAQSRWPGDLVSTGIDSAGAIASALVADEHALHRWARGAVLHTDDRPILEFSAARRMATDRSAAILADLVAAGIRAGPIQLGTSGVVDGPRLSQPARPAPRAPAAASR